MDVKELITLSLSLWAILCFLTSQSFEIFLTLLLIGTLIIYEVSRSYIPKEVRNLFDSMIYLMLFAFAIIVIKKAMEVLK